MATRGGGRPPRPRSACCSRRGCRRRALRGSRIRPPGTCRSVAGLARPLARRFVDSCNFPPIGSDLHIPEDLDLELVILLVESRLHAVDHAWVMQVSVPRVVYG